MAEALGPQEAPGFALHHQLQVHEILGGVEMGPVRLNHQGIHRVEALPPGLLGA